VNWRFVWFLALRYLVSWKKHSAIIVVVIAGSVFLYALTYSMLCGLEYATLSRTLGLAVPHVKVEVSPRDYSKLAELLESDTRISAFSPRLLCDSLLVVGESSRGVRVIGIQYSLENRVSKISRYIVDGSWSVRDDECVIGVVLADKMNVSVGESIYLLLPTGSLWKLRIRGVFETSISEIDSYVVYVDLSELENRLGGDKTYCVALRLKNPSEASMVADWLKEKGYRASSWEKLAGNILRLLEVERFYSNALIGSVLVITSLGIVNIMLMLTESRKKSIGVLKAIGATSREIFSIYFVVSLIYGVLGYLVGLVGAVAVAEALKEVSVEFLSEKITVPFILDSELCFLSLVFSIVVSTISCAYSAYRASTIKPAEVMRFE